MKLLIFGSTGATGRQLVEQALTQGYAVTAFARNPAKVDRRHENLRVVQGDVMDDSSVERATQDQDAVLVALGTGPLTKNTVRSEGTRNVMGAMEKAGVRRFVCLSSIGIGDSRPMLPFHYKYFLVPLLLRHEFAEHEAQENWVKQSRTEWTIVRPGSLTNGIRTGHYRHGLPGADKTIEGRISRADVADFMLRQLRDNTYLYKTPWVSY